jgi:hypothetical protein
MGLSIRATLLRIGAVVIPQRSATLRVVSQQFKNLICATALCALRQNKTADIKVMFQRAFIKAAFLLIMSFSLAAFAAISEELLVNERASIFWTFEFFERRTSGCASVVTLSPD